MIMGEEKIMLQLDGRFWGVATGGERLDGTRKMQNEIQVYFFYSGFLSSILRHSWCLIRWIRIMASTLAAFSDGPWFFECILCPGKLLYSLGKVLVWWKGFEKV